MAYEMTNWEGREGSDLDRFEKANETVKSVLLRNRPNAVTRKGTPFSVQNMNKIERGIYDAHVTAEAESNERKAADRAHNENSSAHPDIRTIINRLIGLPVWDPDNHTIIFTAKDGSTLEVDLPLEDLARDIDFDPATKEIILFKHDGTEIRIDVGDLVDVYTGSLGTHIQITVGENNQINAVLRGGSITDAELSAALLAKINGKLDADAQAADSAKLGGQLPGIYAKQADIQDLQRQINALTPAGMENVARYTFVVNSDAKLKQWADNAPGNDYSRVLVRAGTWTYNHVGIDELTYRIFDMSTGRTKSVNGEAGSKIVFNSEVNYANFWVTLFYGDNNVVINDLLIDANINVGFNDNFVLTGFEKCQVKNNVNININCYFAPGNAVPGNTGDTLDISGIVGVSRITNCDCRVNISGDVRYGSATASAFVGCSLLYFCVGSGFIGAFRNCRTGFGCRGVGNTAGKRAFLNCYMEQISGNTTWDNTAAGGYNYNLTA